MEFSKVLENRFSVRDYKDVPVEEDKIDKIIKAGMQAPTARNTQCEKIYVIKSEEGLNKIREITPCAFNAPLVILTCGDENEKCVTSFDNRSLMETDVAIINTHMMLKATDLGLSTCWVCYFDPALVTKAFNIPENQKPLNLLIVGYKNDNVIPHERHFIIRDEEEVVKYL